MERSNKHNHLFMIELIFSIFFFIICTTICIQLFVNAHLLTQKTEENNHALFISQNIAETFLGYKGDFVQLCHAYDGMAQTNLPMDILDCSSDSCLVLLYDGKDQPVFSSTDAVYCATISHSSVNDLSQIDICIYTWIQDKQKCDHCIYSLSVEKYVGGDVA